MEPAQRIRTHADLERFPSTSAYAQIVHRLGCLNTAVRSNYEPSSAPATPSILLLLALLDHIHQSILSTPLHTTSQRFGNTAFRAFHAQLLLSLPALLAPLVPPSLSVHLPEISHHLVNSFGNPTRIDYGTGHELSFLAFLTILHSLELLKVEDDRVVVEKVFGKYLDVVREAQRWFGLEPAGSKGVWGLDDHQHLSYLFGSSQLIDHPTIRPSSTLALASIPPSQNQYFTSLTHLHLLKTGPFHEHSPLLHNIASTVPNWGKVNSGLLKMWEAEVLGKLVVVQHLWFTEGGVLRWEGMQGEKLESSSSGEVDVVEQKELNVEGWGFSTTPTAPTGSTTSRAATTRSGPTLAQRVGPQGYTATRAPGAAPRSFAPPPFFPATSFPRAHAPSLPPPSGS